MAQDPHGDRGCTSRRRRYAAPRSRRQPAAQPRMARAARAVPSLQDSARSTRSNRHTDRMDMPGRCLPAGPDGGSRAPGHPLQATGPIAPDGLRRVDSNGDSNSSDRRQLITLARSAPTGDMSGLKNGRSCDGAAPSSTWPTYTREGAEQEKAGQPIMTLCPAWTPAPGLRRPWAVWDAASPVPLSAASSAGCRPLSRCSFLGLGRTCKGSFP